MVTSLLIALLVVLIVMSGCASASETALFSLSSMKVKGFKSDSDPRKKLIAYLLDRPRELLVTILMLNIGINILVQNVVSTIFGDYSLWALNVGVPLALTLIFGEIIPKSIGLANNEKIAYRIAPAIRVTEKILYPIRVSLTFITNIVSRCVFFFLRKEDQISVDELKHALKGAKAYGVLNEEEAELVRGYLNLGESRVKDLMRPREEMIYFDVEDPLSKLVHLFVDQECSRIPICENSFDNVLGIMTSRQFFLHRSDLKTTADVIPLLEKPFFVPETISARALLRQLFDRKEILAMVVDEYGTISGLIALEDLVEVVIGEIADRRDEKSRYTMSGEDVLIASGKLELDELEDIFDVSFKSENNMVTIGGWLTEQLGDIPKSGTKYVTDQFFYHVLASDPNRVRRVYIRRLRHPVIKKKRIF